MNILITGLNVLGGNLWNRSQQNMILLGLDLKAEMTF